MATNRIHKPGDLLSVTLTHPTAVSSGQPCRLGGMTGVALTDEGEVETGKTSVDFGTAVWDLPVKGADDDGNTAVAAGDALYYVDADVDDGSGFLSKKTSGRFFGFALEAVTSGSTSTIQVKHVAAGAAAGSADIIDGSIQKTDLAGGFLQVDLLDGQDETGDNTYTLAAMAAADEIVFVGHITTKAAIATLADVTADFTAGAGVLTRSSNPTDNTNDQLMVIWLDLT